VVIAFPEQAAAYEREEGLTREQALAKAPAPHPSIGRCGRAPVEGNPETGKKQKSTLTTLISPIPEKLRSQPPAATACKGA
jgi:hypothetical protein